ncbi:dihydrodipicolinate reductase-like protein CRR1, chloroplastic isoform X4 [Vitis riparia]|uniref:dihydrodipicolinate reductase-like protein CRR1, chloroplastic isoform X4 n=1 Tax=Vitis riparia TaxID=96939 RepID=UPI00155AC76A|nr:dihydrodipicolinate reductase-like protein CRR1, chloroplastic isoform X4 [Vitis riparia]XP_034711077.1 dihydrodipicolinate reductase-like protein CRR1, chloroplastic isoform X4 [Vitis riparia]
MAAALSSQFHPTTYRSIKNVKTKQLVSCSMQQPSQSNIKVVINGAAKEIGRAAVVAVTKARGMEVAGAVDSHLVGEDIGMVCGMEEALEMPIINDLTMVLGSISQSKATGVVVDFTDPSTVYENVKQATAFGMNSVVYVPRIKLDTVTALSAFCEKASMVSTGTFHHQMQSKLLTTSQTWAKYTTEKTFQQIFWQEVKFWVMMGSGSIAWSFQAFRLAQPSTSPALERFTLSNMTSQMCGVSCQA